MQQVKMMAKSETAVRAEKKLIPATKLLLISSINFWKQLVLSPLP